MRRFCVESESLSSDSDHLESFLSQIKKSAKEPKYRLSTNSLSDFITNSSCTSDDSYDQSYKENRNNNKAIKNTAKHFLNCDTGIHENQCDGIAPQAKVEQLSTSLSRHHSRSLCDQRSEDIGKIKSVATPVRKVIFSSDSDDNVFDTVAATKSKKVNRTPFQPVAFSDSEKENCFEVYRNIPTGVPQFIMTSSDESDDPISGKTQKPLFSSVGDIDSDNDYMSLKDRLLKNCELSKDLNTNGQKSGSLVHATGSLTYTPQKKIVTTDKQYFHTEKVLKTVKKTCLVPGCFLDSLDGVTQKYSGSSFKKTKLELTAKLFKFFNHSVFSNRLPDTMKVSWAKRLTKTAGLTKCRRQVSKCNGNSAPKCINYEAEIALSDKVIDCASRLRDTLIHEMCHAAVWVLNNVNESHGPFWKSWAAKARKIHPELPSIDRCHNYDIECKYQYKCTRCDSMIGRHSKSIDMEKKVCGRCTGKLVLLTKKKGSNPFANFVKENYKDTKVKMESVSFPISHREVMMSLSEQFKATSIA